MLWTELCAIASKQPGIAITTGIEQKLAAKELRNGVNLDENGIIDCPDGVGEFIMITLSFEITRTPIC